jgi:hypothetical protein
MGALGIKIIYFFEKRSLMNSSRVQFKISQLRHQNLVTAAEAIAVVVFAFFAVAFLPRILFTYLFANQQLLEEPAVLTHMPLAFFLIGTAYFIYALVTNVLRSIKIAALEKELDSMPSMGGSCCDDCNDCVCDEHGDCACGCDDAAPAMSSTSAMAAKMSAVSKKRKTAKRK